MTAKKLARVLVQSAAAGAGLAIAAYAAHAAVTWARYGHSAKEQGESLLDRFMPAYEVAERHQILVDAPHAITLSAACDMDLQQSAVIRGIFKARELMLNGKLAPPLPVQGLLAQMKELGWGVLAECPGREIVMGAVTQPWEPNPVFSPLPSQEFADFQQPNYVKIVWNLRADPAGSSGSLFRTETRALATSPAARSRFRLYWSFVSPGVWLIRHLSLGPLKKDAERRFRAATLPRNRAPYPQPAAGLSARPLA